jgi:hypothetical protein
MKLFEFAHDFLSHQNQIRQKEKKKDFQNSFHDMETTEAVCVLWLTRKRKTRETNIQTYALLMSYGCSSVIDRCITLKPKPTKITIREKNPNGGEGHIRARQVEESQSPPAKVQHKRQRAKAKRNDYLNEMGPR